MKEEAHLCKSTILANVLFYYCRQLQLPRSIHVEFYSHNGHWKKTIGRIWLIYSFPIFAWGAHNSYVTCISESPSNFLFQYRRSCGLLFIMFLSCCWSEPAVAGSQLALPSSGSPAVTKRKKRSPGPVCIWFVLCLLSFSTIYHRVVVFFWILLLKPGQLVGLNFSSKQKGTTTDRTVHHWQAR